MLRILIASLGALLVASCASLSSSFLGRSSEMVYVVEASGGAWSASAKAREAMTSIEGIDELHMSGARAVFGMEPGRKPDQEQIAAAFEDRGMQLERFERVKRPRAEGVVLVDSGVTWAVTAGKVREALMNETGVIDVYFEERIEILVAEPDTLSMRAVEDVLSANEVGFTTIEAAR